MSVLMLKNGNQWVHIPTIKGADGTSPSASVSKSGDTATITITDSNGTTTAQVSDGTDATVYDLTPTGDTTDRASEIMSVLTANSVCRLAPGDYYVTGITMSFRQMIIGSGNKTRIILASSVTDGYAIKLGTYGLVKGLCVCGGTSHPTPQANIRTRRGIVFESTYSTDQSTFYRAMISDVAIENFEGSGLRFNDTGGLVGCNVLVSNVHISYCDAGVNVPYYSEYHRFVNISVANCYYGAYVNGGNCNFANCSFSGCTVGLYMRDSGSALNNSHGGFSNCAFNHSGNNSGTAIWLVGLDYGELFTNTNVFFGGIVITGCVGIRFVGGNFGTSVPVTVTDSTMVSFTDITVKDSSSSPITQSGNTDLRFRNCRRLDGSAWVDDTGTETWTFTLANGTTVTKKVVVS